jgi:predicted ArsR family transcriptional regulator
MVGGGPPGAIDALVPARQARLSVLGRPAARRVVAALQAGTAPMTAQEVADAIGRHHTGVRAQLIALEEVGVIEGHTDPPGRRGRPVRRYAPIPDPDEREAEGHRELVRLLTRLVGQLGLGPEEMESFGQRQGAGITRGDGGVAELWRAFERMGFAPHAPDDGCPADVVLGRCPFVDGVEAPGGELICVLHRGLARGILQRAAPEVRVAGLITEDPRRAGCRLRLTSGATSGPDAGDATCRH